MGASVVLPSYSPSVSLSPATEVSSQHGLPAVPVLRYHQLASLEQLYHQLASLEQLYYQLASLGQLYVSPAS